MSTTTPRAQAIYRSYCEMAASGTPEAVIRLTYEEGDLEVVQDMVMKEYWKHVRSLLRAAPVFQRKLDFLASFLEKPVEDVLDAIATAHFPRLTIAFTQRGHQWLRAWINELFKHANDQLDGAVEVQPVYPQTELYVPGPVNPDRVRRFQQRQQRRRRAVDPY